ncbi:MAG: hypothetical protein EPO36_06245 [Chloroflexota bacterium]|nr:MAG: hypothetical protein EPO36_06245 [Chloroflexota bacterium]
MGPQDHLGALLDGMGCTVCEEHVPGARIRLLAQRDDLLFLQLDCPGCGSTSLVFVADATVVPAAGPPPVAPEAVRLAGADPVSADDVLDMHAFLAAWTGDLDDLVRPAGHAGWAARPDLRRSGRSA